MQIRWLTACLVAAEPAKTPPLHSRFKVLQQAQDVTVVGPVAKIEFATDQKSAVATLKDGRSGEDVKVIVNDELTLDKIKDKRIVEGDDIRARFQKRDGGNASKSFRGTDGC